MIMKVKSINFKIAVLFLAFTAVFTLFRSSMSGIFSLFYARNGILNVNISSIILVLWLDCFQQDGWQIELVD